MKCTLCGYDPMVEMVRIVQTLGSGEKRCMPSEVANRVAARKSVTAVVDIQAGTTIDVTMVGNRRPCPEGALPPKDLVSVLGQRTTRDVQAGESLCPDMVTRGED